MSRDIAQLIGTILISSFGVLVLVIAWTRRCPSSLREAAFTAGGYLIVIAIVRLFVQAHWVSQQDGRVLNGLLVVPFLAALLIPIIAHRLVKHVD